MTAISTSASSTAVKLLVINPNSSKVMTRGLDKLIADLAYPKEVQIDTYTAPSGPDSINNEDDAMQSAIIVRDDLTSSQKLIKYSGFLVCCYSVHPLIPMLRSVLPASKPVSGIFEASISTSLALLSPPPPPPTGGGTYESFGIVSTGKYWEKVLSDGVVEYLGAESAAGCRRFGGVETTGLTAGELHSVPEEEVRRRMMDAVRRLVGGGSVRAVCLGCAGMAGMDEMVREACVEALGEERGKAVHVIDGVKAGVAILDGLIRSRTAGN